MTACLILHCTAPAVATASQRKDAPPDFCALHFAYFTVTLADERYRADPVPEFRVGGLQGRLL